MVSSFSESDLPSESVSPASWSPPAAGSQTSFLESARDLFGARDSGEVLRRIARRALQNLAGDTAAVYLLDPSIGRLRAAAAFGRVAKALEGEIIEPGRGILGTVAKTGIPEVVNDVTKDSRAIEIPDTPKTEEGDKLLGVPLLSDGRPIGLMAVWKRHAAPDFGLADVRYLEGLSGIAVIAIENARSYENAQRRIGQLSTLTEIGRALATAQSQDELLELVHRQMSLLYDTSNFYIATYAEGDSHWTSALKFENGARAAPRSYEIGEGLTGHILATREPLLMKNPEVNRAFHEARGVVSIGRSSKSWMGVPLIAGKEILGVMAIQSYELADLYDEEDLGFLSLVGMEVGVAIQNARRFDAKEAARAEAEEANRQKSLFLAKMSHELRTPLNAIINFAYLLRLGSEGPVNQAQEGLLGAVEEAGRHLLGLINDILDLAKVEAGRMELFFEEFDLNVLAQETIGTAMVLVKDRPIGLELSPAERPAFVIADRTRIRQVFLNLLSNAVKFTDRGTIGVSLSWRGDDGVVVSVRDTGRGIAPGKLEAIFKEFVQGEEGLTAGTGLGLPISRSFVELHGGSLMAESRPGLGSTFSFFLPAQGPASRRQS